MTHASIASLIRHFDLPLLSQSAGSSAGQVESYSPGDGSLLGRVAASTNEQYDATITRAVEAARAWAEVPAPRRGELVRLFAEELRRNKHELAQLVTLENGKIIAEALGEVQEMIDIADLAVGQSRMLYGRTMHSERSQHRMYEQWHPLGVVGIISAFNFPVAVWSWNALLAVVCGNACVWKPSPKTPLCALAVQQLCNRVLERHGAPPIFQLLLDQGSEHGQRLAADHRVALLSFTGSTAVGRGIAQTVAARLGKSLLELGGNNAIIVDETADLDMAARAIVFGALGTAGQRCTSTRRVIVQRSRLEALEQKLVHAYRQARIGDPLDAKTLVGPLIDRQAVQAFERAIAAARAAGGRLLVGGAVLQRPGNFVEPAIIVAQNDWDIVQHETFAPILYLIPADSLDDAIAIQNQSAYGLSSALFTQRLANAERYLSHGGSDCGIANINIGTSGAEIGGAFGGEKDTGGGREAGSDAWQAYMRRQTNTTNWSSALPLAQGIEFESTAG
jgi:aldehyde dehydrogenase (NAD+)